VTVADDAKVMTEPILTRPQFDAARMLVARLHAEAANIPFDVKDVGWTWLTADDAVCAVADDGTELRQGDVLYAAVVLLWSMVVSCADSQARPIDAVIAQLGLGVASNEPTSTS
jgi:hypothetical protein